MRVDRAIICAMRTGMTSVMTGFIVAACGRALRRGRCPTAVATMVFEVADAPFLGRTGQRPDFANLGTAGPLLGLGDGPRGVDQPDVAERLREVADHLAVAGVDLLGQQPDIVDGGHGTLEGHGGRLDLTAAGSSWLNQVEIWFGIITRQAIRRGTFSSVRVLTQAINNYIASWNEDSVPFEWSATADKIRERVALVDPRLQKTARMQPQVNYIQLGDTRRRSRPRSRGNFGLKVGSSRTGAPKECGSEYFRMELILSQKDGNGMDEEKVIRAAHGRSMPS